MKALNYNNGENSSEERLDFLTLDEATIKPSHNVGCHPMTPYDAPK